MECDLHLFSVSCSEDSIMLRIFLIILQQNTHGLPNMLLWLPKHKRDKHKLCEVSQTLYFYS
jgi:hypothetical protein